MFASASCLSILPLNQMIADFLPTKHIFTKPGPSFNKNRAVWCPLPSKHASSPIYLWGALYWIQTDHECYPALYKTSHGIGNLIQGFKWIATLPVWSARIFFFFILLSNGIAWGNSQAFTEFMSSAEELLSLYFAFYSSEQNNLFRILYSQSWK